jgi:hypothetical protein
MQYNQEKQCWETVKPEEDLDPSLQFNDDSLASLSNSLSFHDMRKSI